MSESTESLFLFVGFIENKKNIELKPVLCFKFDPFYTFNWTYLLLLEHYSKTDLLLSPAANAFVCACLFVWVMCDCVMLWISLETGCGFVWRSHISMKCSGVAIQASSLSFFLFLSLSICLSLSPSLLAGLLTHWRLTGQQEWLQYNWSWAGPYWTARLLLLHMVPSLTHITTHTQIHIDTP